MAVNAPEQDTTKQQAATNTDTINSLAEMIGVEPATLQAALLQAQHTQANQQPAPVNAWSDKATSIEDKLEALYRTVVKSSTQAVHVLEEELQNLLAFNAGQKSNGSNSKK